MPFAKRRTTTRRKRGPSAKRRPRRKTRYYSRRAFITRSVGGPSLTGRKLWSAQVGMPRRLPIKVRYQDTWFNMSTAGAWQTVNVFSGNSPYDPDATGVGVQPYSWDQLAAFYNYYRCNAAKIVCTFYPSTPVTTTSKQAAIIFPLGSAAQPTNHSFPDLMQIAGAKMVQLSSGRLDNRPIVLKHYWSTKKAWRGVYNAKDNDFVAAMNTNPSQRWYFHVYTDSVDAATNATIYMDVRITYYVFLENRIPLAQS